MSNFPRSYIQRRGTNHISILFKKIDLCRSISLEIIKILYRNISHNNNFRSSEFIWLILIILQLVDSFVGGRGTITENASKSNIKSNIYVPKASVMDSGNYTCISPSFNINTTVKVHVLVDGKNIWMKIRNTIYKPNFTLIEIEKKFYEYSNNSFFFNCCDFS